MLLQKTNPHKVAEPDSIPANYFKVLKECADELTPMLTIFFNKTLSEGTIPDDWKKANVTAIFKKGNRSDAANSSAALPHKSLLQDPRTHSHQQHHAAPRCTQGTFRHSTWIQG